ncbi:sarcosine oxidase subunit alpha [Limibacillus sp. MBR-115]|jgi:sarcosine oxidase subunit alpha|uniref:sarcosine oxidase subunit alpha n=1 Tax=Limibacillus sp. MBR-115 TaxID=3156465 RepID=UPI003395AA16
MTDYRLRQGGRIDRSKSLSFTFDGQRYAGYAGDTLASALLANGVHFVGRSFKYHRPRGIVAAGAEEPNALIQLGHGARTEPNLRATQIELFDGLRAESQNRWPSLSFDVGALNNALSKFFPAGFYYKTFMWPAALWMKYEYVIRHAAGLGKSPTERDPDTYDKTNAHCDVLIVGAGPSGLAAALAAAKTGARVILCDEQAEMGGSLLNRHAEIGGKTGADWVADSLKALAQYPNLRLLPRTTAFAYWDHNFISLCEKVTDHLADKPKHLPRQRLWKVRAKQVVLATGALERPLVFQDNDRPGIMLAGAAQTYLNRYAVKPGNRGIVFTNNDGGYEAAIDLADAGVAITVLDSRDMPEGANYHAAKTAGLDIRAGKVIVGTKGSKRVEKALIADLGSGGDRALGQVEELDVDFIASSGGWNPTVHLFCQSKGKLEWRDDIASFVPGEPMQKAQASVGAANGAFGLKDALAEGFAAGAKLAAASGLGKAAKPTKAPDAPNGNHLPLQPLWLVPSTEPLGRKGKHFTDFQNDVTAADLKLALREGYRSVEHVKRYTTTGMATDQGKIGNVNALGIVADVQGKTIPEVGVTTFRPPYTPTTFGIFMGRDADDLLDPARTTPMHSWHQRAGAQFEDVGQWKRAWYYPKDGEDLHAAVNREVAAVRRSLGVLDASTLGKIDIQGPDAAEFLNRIYTNAWKKLDIGKARYGLMLKEDGMVMDDGVTTRIGENRFLMTTTSGNAPQVMAHLEDYLQTEWTDLKVYLTSVTEQWATISVAGPNARKLMAELTSDIGLSPNALPFMGYTEGTVAGVPARVFRISFTGELSFEINVPASYGLAVWQAVMTAGEKYDITPYGTEAMHVLRAEKGYIIVGQETDGSVNPHDLGMDWVVAKNKEFVGKRSLTRADMSKPNRKQLVGILTDDPKTVLPEGSQIVEELLDKPPMTMVGHVTSSYWSPNLGHSIALAMVKGGLAKKGKKIYVPLLDGRVVSATITDTVFFDPEGERLRA